MYRRPRFLEVLRMIREQMSRDCDYDLDLFVQMLRKEYAPEESTAQEMLIPATKGPPRRSPKIRRTRAPSPHESPKAHEPRRE